MLKGGKDGIATLGMVVGGGKEGGMKQHVLF